MNRRRRQLNIHINVTPFVDVMLVLLVIFILTAPVLYNSISVQLPSSNINNITSQNVPKITITVRTNGNLYVNSKEIKQQDLLKVIKKISNNNTAALISIRADKQVIYGKLVYIMNMLHDSSYNKVVLIVKPYVASK